MRIDIFCGYSHEPFSPKSKAEGRGGSEEMVINMAFELSKRHKVFVWNRCQADEGFYYAPGGKLGQGVEYKNFDDFDVKKTDILIVWRSPESYHKYNLDKVEGRKYLWLHDTVNQLDVLPYIYLYDGILTLSKWHKEFYDMFVTEEHRDRFIKTRNAVLGAEFKQKIKRDPYTIVYGSLYNRGLVELLTVWSDIKLEVPEAKLRVFYGWETLEKILPIEQFKPFKEKVENLLDQEGVTHLGRISHKEVAKEMLGAGIWAYPNTYNEVSCITAMKAQLAGAIPVVIPKAALSETVKYGVKVTDGNNLGEILSSWSKHLIDILQRPKDAEALRRLMIKNSDFSFKQLAKDWEAQWMSVK